MSHTLQCCVWLFPLCAFSSDSSSWVISYLLKALHDHLMKKDFSRSEAHCTLFLKPCYPHFVNFVAYRCVLLFLSASKYLIKLVSGNASQRQLLSLPPNAKEFNNSFKMPWNKQWPGQQVHAGSRHTCSRSRRDHEWRVCPLVHLPVRLESKTLVKASGFKRNKELGAAAKLDRLESQSRGAVITH